MTNSPTPRRTKTESQRVVKLQEIVKGIVQWIEYLEMWHLKICFIVKPCRLPLCKCCSRNSKIAKLVKACEKNPSDGANIIDWIPVSTAVSDMWSDDEPYVVCQDADVEKDDIENYLKLNIGTDGLRFSQWMTDSQSRVTDNCGCWNSFEIACVSRSINKNVVSICTMRNGGVKNLLNLILSAYMCWF